MTSVFADAPAEDKFDIVDGSGRKFKLPSEGRFKVQFDAEPSCPNADDVAPDAGVEALIRILKGSKTDVERQNLFEIATSGSDLYFTKSQAQELLESCKSIFNKMQMVMRLVFVMASPEECVALVEANLDYNQRVELRMRLGQKWNIVMGMPGSAYSIDYSDESDIHMGKLLYAVATAERDKSKELGQDTSQFGGFVNMRNVSVRRRFPSSTPTSSQLIPQDAIGAEVDVRLEGSQKYVPGVIEKENRDGTFDIKFEDGDNEFTQKDVRPECIKPTSLKHSVTPFTGEMLKILGKPQVAVQDGITEMTFDYVSTTIAYSNVHEMSTSRYDAFLDTLGLNADTVLAAVESSAVIDEHLTTEMVTKKLLLMRSSTFKEATQNRGYQAPTAADVHPKFRPEPQVIDTSKLTIKPQFRTLLLKLYEVQAMACKLYFSMEQVIHIWSKFDVRRIKDRRGRAHLAMTDDKSKSNKLTDLAADSQFIRIELLMSLFGRIIDMHNFHRLLERYLRSLREPHSLFYRQEPSLTIHPFFQMPLGPARKTDKKYSIDSGF